MARLELSLSSGPSLVIGVHEGLYLQKEGSPTLCKNKTGDLCHRPSLSLIYEWVKNECFIENAVGLAEMLF